MIVFTGIDVACRRDGHLPICVATREGDRHRPIEVPADQRMRLPRGPGNREILAAEPFKSLAIQVARALKEISVMQHLRIDRIAIDAPAAPPKAGTRRLSIRQPQTAAVMNKSD